MVERYVRDVEAAGSNPVTSTTKIINADVAKLADAQDLGSCGAIRAGSSPVIRRFL